MNQLELFPEVDDVEQEVQAILARRRAMNVSGQAGEDIDLIRSALKSARGLA
ncbi:hypothetical protein [Paucibacter sp. KBW04]|uniref:hypothetical protein n=1 Tax=Paucibacter sp. KBW04 TaxID=2153361 RepID=UPI0012DC7C77|nr:hypothetical protein [Paucibacter sp. KBW04]